MHATCFIILTDKQENSHTEGVWHHHYIFNWNAETRRREHHPHQG
jgi:hypothetical protein